MVLGPSEYSHDELMAESKQKRGRKFSLEAHEVWRKRVLVTCPIDEIIVIHTSSKECSFGPIHGQHTACAETHTLGEVDTAPEIHGDDTTAKAHATKVKDGSVTNVRQAPEVPIFESLVDGLIEVTVIDFICFEAGKSGGNLGKLTTEVDTLLVSTLGGGRQGSELGIDLM